jgi:serine O-acetyltransferase
MSLVEPSGNLHASTSAPISAREPDWSRESKRFWHWWPSRSLLASVRAYQTFQQSHRIDHVAMRWLAVLRHRFWSAVTGADVPLVCRIDGGLMLPHPNGVVVHPDARIGPNCMIFQQVTLGNGGPIRGAPVLAGHVDVGAGAKILGGVRIGEHAVIGANAVVLCDVPAGATAVGVPARIIQRQATERREQR